MQLGNFHLTYCSNIHPGESWEEVRANLARYLPQVRRQSGWQGPMGVGLRLSAQAAETLAQPEELARFADFLAAEQGYVFTINGFPYGVFHGVRVKEDVYLPDWQDEERLRYTSQLAEILATLLPEQPGLEGSISTVPGAFKERIQNPEDVRRMAWLMLREAAVLHEIRQRTGKLLTLAIEPEPCCHVETVEEAISFFTDWLQEPGLLRDLAGLLGTGVEEARQVVREHIGLCYDACHMAIEFEDAGQALERLTRAGLKICKFQISSALKLKFRRGDAHVRQVLAPFAESTYLHQVVERSRAGLVRFTDLPQALDSVAPGPGRKVGEELEWRVHFHVPIFLEEMRNFQTTQDHLTALLDLLKRQTPCPYLEVETYTWDVLPAEYKTGQVADAIARELNWVRNRIEA